MLAFIIIIFLKVYQIVKTNNAGKGCMPLLSITKEKKKQLSLCTHLQSKVYHIKPVILHDLILNLMCSPAPNPSMYSEIWSNGMTVFCSLSPQLRHPQNRFQIDLSPLTHRQYYRKLMLSHLSLRMFYFLVCLFFTHKKEKHIALPITLYEME